MKKLLLFILILVAVAGVCVVTCPDKASHIEALKDVLNTAITEELSDSGDSDSDAGFIMFGSMIGTGIGGLVIDNMLKVDNHFVFCLQHRHNDIRRENQGRFRRNNEPCVYSRQRRLEESGERTE